MSRKYIMRILCGVLVDSSMIIIYCVLMKYTERLLSFCSRSRDFNGVHE